MELRRYLRLFRHHILLILLTTLVGAAIGYATTSRTALYTARSTIYVGSKQLETNLQYNYGISGLDQIVATFALMIPSEVIAQSAIDATHVDRSAGQVVSETKAVPVENATGTATNLITVSVTDPDPVVAQELANAVADAFTSKVRNYDPATSSGAGSLPSEPAYVFQDATLPTSPLPFHTKERVILGALLGLVLSILAVLLLDYLDVTVKGAEDLERRIGLPVLGIVPLLRDVTGPPGVSAAVRSGSGRAGAPAAGSTSGRAHG